MTKNIEKSSKKMEILIGVLLIVPTYIFLLIILNLLNITDGDNTILFPILMYLPIIIGVIISQLKKTKNNNRIISYAILGFWLLAILFYYNTYFVEHEGWEGLGPYVFWLINTAICRILSCIYYAKLFGWKKAFIILISYILIVVASFLLGFWA